jgi:hypothetical protein
MSHEDVETIRAVFEATQRPEILDRLGRGALDLGLYDPEIEWDTTGLASVIPSDTSGVYWGARGGADLLATVA